jgi:hypothetical protein
MAALMYMFCGGCTCVLIMTTSRLALIAGNEARLGKVDASVCHGTVQIIRAQVQKQSPE